MSTKSINVQLQQLMAYRRKHVVPGSKLPTDDYFKRLQFKQNQFITRTTRPQRLRESMIRGKRTGVQQAQPRKEAY